MKTLSLALILVILMPTFTYAGTSCTTRKIGSVTITSCSRASQPSGYTTCRSYKSGSVVKTSCS